MISVSPDCPAGVCLLADHLDTALAIGEDLLALTLPPRADLDEHAPESAPDVVDAFVRRLRQLEQSLVVRILQARNRLREVAGADSPMRLSANLFRAQTEVLLDLASAAEARLVGRFDGGADAFAYLRSRGLIAPEAAAPSPFESVSVTETMRIGGAIELGPLLDMVSSVLDLLDARYDLYMPSPDELYAAASARPHDPETRAAEGTDAVSASAGTGATADDTAVPATVVDGDSGEPDAATPMPEAAATTGAAEAKDAAEAAEAASKPTAAVSPPGEPPAAVSPPAAFRSLSSALESASPQAD